VKTHDVLIVGGGLAGGSLALALVPIGLRVAMVESVTSEQRRHSPAGDRALALSKGSVDIFEELGIWELVKEKATPIRHIHVSDRGHFGKARLHARDFEVEAFGYVIPARELENAVMEACQQMDMEIICPAKAVKLHQCANHIEVMVECEGKRQAYGSRLLVAADGGQSKIREWLGIGQTEYDYRQTALVTTVVTEKFHSYVAYERFTDSGPLAFLPLPKSRCAVIWSNSHQQAKALTSCSEKEFLSQLQNAFGWKLGRLELAAPVRSFPLRQIQAERLFAERSAVIGNAAHQLHPVAGQGFNLGLRDVMGLAKCIQEQFIRGADPGALVMLEKYAKARTTDHKRVIGFSDSLIHLFVPSFKPVALGRNLGLVALDHLPAVKRWFARQAMGLEQDLV